MAVGVAEFGNCSGVYRESLQGELTGQMQQICTKVVVFVNPLKYVCVMNDAKTPHLENQNGIIHIRNWIRTNGVMSDDGRSITYNCKELEGVIADALRLPLVISCGCPNEIKTGTVSIDCCNICGKPDEDWWGKH